MPDIILTGLKEGIEGVFNAIWPFAESAKRLSKLSEEEKRCFLEKNISLLRELTKNGENLHAIAGGEYINKSCREGQLFEKAGVIYGHKSIDEIEFGLFPQDEQSGGYLKDEVVKRPFDKEISHYAPVEWIVIGDNERNGKYLSKKLLLSIDYLGTKHPLYGSENSIAKIINKNFNKYFKSDNKNWKITNVRFLLERELNTLLARSKRGEKTQQLKKKREILLPEITHFSKISNRKTIQAFWLAGDMEDAKRVDSGSEKFSNQPLGAELYYIRIVIEVEKS